MIVENAATRSKLFMISLAICLSACASGTQDTGNALENRGDIEAGAAGNDGAPEMTGGTQLAPYDPGAVPGMSRVQDRSYVLMSALWENPNIAVCWESASNPTERQMVRDAIKASWEANSVVRFFGWGVCATNAKGIRITVSDAGPHTKGLGNQLNGKLTGMVLNFTFANWSQPCASSQQQRESCIRSIAVHEFGHALGFAHEQNRPDTPGECTKKPQGTNGDKMLTPWDLRSVMNYCNPVYNNDAKLSPLDVQALKDVYH